MIMKTKPQIIKIFIGTAIYLWLNGLGTCHAIDLAFDGQFSAWSNTFEYEDKWRNNTGLRYIPGFQIRHDITADMFWDVECALNGYVYYNTEDSSDDADLDVYRLTLRFATAKTEFRLGLQKISFGPALLLRSLQWFDRVDPRDPQRLTDGVYGLRITYNTLNNSSLWLWCLLENDEPKGFEIFSTDPDKPEFGGRFQFPIPQGELAATIHTREAEYPMGLLPDFTERRIAVDGWMDIGVGIWFETVFRQQKSPALPFEWLKLVTTGMDYTFDIGNGLHILGEHMVPVLSDDIMTWDEKTHFTAFSANYPFGYFDALTAIGYYAWDHKEYSQYVSWQRSYDHVIINLSLFKYPDTNLGASLVTSGLTTSGLQTQNLERGSGGQILVILNH